MRLPKEGRIYEEFKIREGTWLRVSLAPFRGGVKLHVREWWSPGVGEGPFPTQRGIAVEASPDLLRRMASAVAMALDDVEAEGPLEVGGDLHPDEMAAGTDYEAIS